MLFIKSDCVKRLHLNDFFFLNSMSSPQSYYYQCLLKCVEIAVRFISRPPTVFVTDAPAGGGPRGMMDPNGVAMASSV